MKVSANASIIVSHQAMGVVRRIPSRVGSATRCLEIGWLGKHEAAAQVALNTWPERIERYTINGHDALQS